METSHYWSFGLTHTESVAQIWDVFYESSSMDLKYERKTGLFWTYSFVSTQLLPSLGLHCCYIFNIVTYGVFITL